MRGAPERTGVRMRNQSVPTSSQDVEISVVFPVYNERGNLAPLLAEIEQALAGESYEIVAVDDGSTDGSTTELRALQRPYPKLRVSLLDRHAGQSSALMDGFDRARGRLVVTMDGDGQNDPADVPALLAAFRSGDDDAVVGRRVRRADGRWRLLQARIANAARNWITGDRVRDTGCSLRVARRSALVALPRFDGMHRFIPTLLRLHGQRVVEVDVTHRRRRYGHSSYGVRNRLFVGVRDAFRVRRMAREARRRPVPRENTDP